MDSPGRITPARRSLQASLAIFKTDVSSLARSWVLRGWIIALALAEFFLIATTIIGAKGSRLPASTIVAANLSGFLLIWSTLIIVMSAGSVSHEADIISDSILSRACTRVQFILAKLLSRILVTLGVYLIATIAVGYAAYRYAPSDITPTTLATGIGIVALAVLLLVSLGVLFSVVINNTIVSVVSLLLLWYVASPVFAFVGAEYLSPTSLVRNLPAILKDPHAPQLVQCSATKSSLTVVFSENVDAASAEEPSNYSIETDPDTRTQPATATYDATRTTVILGGLSFAAGQKIRVTVQNVVDSGGTPISDAANTVECVAPGATRPSEAHDKAKPRADMAPPTVLRITATQSSVTVYFSESLDPDTAEDATNFQVENPVGVPRSPRAATYRSDRRTVLLSGLKLDLDVPVKLSAKGVKDLAGNAVAAQRSSAMFTEVTPWKYVLGFGLPAVVCALLSVLWFNRRDL
jgi:ABC-type transport system involved in multi-copper enzyme maturation permease subunit